MYCVINPKTRRLHRCTFSKSLAEFIVQNYHPELEVATYRYKLGKKLAKGESSSGVYAVMSTKKDIVLRISLIKDQAELYCDYDSRYLQEVFLVLE